MRWPGDPRNVPSSTPRVTSWMPEGWLEPSREPATLPSRSTKEKTSPRERPFRQSLSGFTRLVARLPVPGARPQPHMPSAHMRGGPGAPDFSRNAAACAFILKSGTGPRTVGGDLGKGTGQSWPLPMPAWWRHCQRELWRMGKCYDLQELFLGLCSKALSQISGEPDAVTNLSFLTRRWKARQLDSGIVR